ncbi:hypothetical protein PsorP6_007657 [Peronosclerospora sorghi]|uniref:Uncharacterized protein n=1 Tax=Peronosclerospora sorghi TaxID=230839 RepID=A0ACC0WAG7_9STRA|nr:hypothetical protein PsorP6_007657 [Peronosclerospora sorghi]
MFDLYIQNHIGKKPSVPALVVFAQVIAHSPKAVYLPHLTHIFLLVARALNINDRELGSDAVQTFKPLLFDSGSMSRQKKS